MQQTSLHLGVLGHVSVLEATAFVCSLVWVNQQIPLHVWLPESMSPTPISALIHAATMVTAGVYLVVRLSPLFELAKSHDQ